MLDAMKVYDRQNQPVILAPFALCGAMLAGPALALVGLLAFQRVTRPPAIAVQDQVVPVPFSIAT